MNSLESDVQTYREKLFSALLMDRHLDPEGPHTIYQEVRDWFLGSLGQEQQRAAADLLLSSPLGRTLLLELDARCGTCLHDVVQHSSSTGWGVKR